MSSEASTETTALPRRIPLWVLAVLFWGLYLLAVLVARTDLSGIPRITTFGVIFSSIVIEAFPFILLGSLVSAAMEVYVPDRAFSRIARLPRTLQVPGATLAGCTFPVCECGSVPIGRRLISRGLHPAAALGFMFAAPILNPIVVLSTWVAYGGGVRGLEMVGGRSGLGFLVAMSAGIAISRGRTELLRNPGPQASADACTHDHGHDHGQAHGHGPDDQARSRFPSFLEHMTADLMFMGRFLLLGAAASALMQTLVPQDILSGVAGLLVVGTLALMAFAFILSLCAAADAFVATSFTGFPLGAQLAFLVFGPILDAKLAPMYGATFRRPFIGRLLIVSVPLIVLGTLLFEAVIV